MCRCVSRVLVLASVKIMKSKESVKKRSSVLPFTIFLSSQSFRGIAKEVYIFEGIDSVCTDPSQDDAKTSVGRWIQVELR